MTLPLTIVSQIREGGTIGSGAWGARILGPGKGKWQFRLTFCDKRYRTSLSGESGRLELHVKQAGIYQLWGVGDFQGEGDWAGFIRVDPAGNYEILGGQQMSPREVLKQLAPYPSCLHPEQCIAAHRCTNDPVCND